MSVTVYLADTNVLLRLSQSDSPEYPLMRLALERLWTAAAQICYTAQNITEFWNVCARPAQQNGFGFSISETDERVSELEQNFVLLPDNEYVHREWRRLVVDYSVRGVQVHDARLVASMRVHGVRNVLTLNQRDFSRYSGITAVHPRELIREQPNP
jgi:predicted nucleic acid-binding protein